MYISKTGKVLLGTALTIMVIGGRIHAFAAVIMKMQTLTMATLAIIFTTAAQTNCPITAAKQRNKRNLSTRLAALCYISN